MSNEALNIDGRSPINQPVVLCVATDPDLREIVRQYCSSLPCRILTSDKYEEALAMVDAHRVNLVLADHRLNMLSGTQFLKDVARRSPATARVLLGPHEEHPEALQDSEDTVHGIIGTWDGPSLQRTIMAILRWQEERIRAATPELTRTSRLSQGRNHPSRPSGHRQPEREEEGIRQTPRKSSHQG
jgi:DNA-binding NtrC family response regulator